MNLLLETNSGCPDYEYKLFKVQEISFSLVHREHLHRRRLHLKMVCKSPSINGPLLRLYSGITLECVKILRLGVHALWFWCWFVICNLIIGSLKTSWWFQNATKVENNWSKSSPRVFSSAKQKILAPSLHYLTRILKIKNNNNNGKVLCYVEKCY
jgi:hypothetical protein